MCFLVRTVSGREGSEEGGFDTRVFVGAVAMTRPPSCADEREQGLKKGPWTPDEDQKLVAYIQQHGHGSWRSLPINAGM